jgi:DNA-binding transcriptional LysR family regulator
MDMVATYRQRYPDVVVDISFEDRLVDLVAEGYDLAIRATADPPSAGLVARPLRPMPFVIAASEEYLQRCGVPQSPEELAQHDCIMIGNGQSWHLTGPNGNIAVPARVVLRFGAMTIAAAHAVCTGIGLAALPHIILEDPMFKDVLRPVLVMHPLRHPHLYAIYVSRRQLQLKIRTFIDHVVEHTQIPHPWNDLAGVEPEC